MSIRTIATIFALTGAFITPAAFAKHEHVQTGTGLQSGSSATQGRTREQVIQQVLQAQRDGTLAKMRGETTYAPEFERPMRSVLTRDQVNSDVLRTQRDGTLDKSRGEATYAPELERSTRSVLTRAEVKQEVLHARHDGVLDMMRGEASDFAAVSAVIAAH